MMELWASGFNAWGQLDFESPSRAADSPVKTRDLTKFKCILRDEHIEIIQANLSVVLVETSLGPKLAGYPDRLVDLRLKSTDRLRHLAVAGNDKVVEAKSGHITQFSSVEDFIHRKGTQLEAVKGIVQTVANQTTFTSLTETGEVYSWGDGRYEDCLGRQVSDRSPASRPCLVEDLLDLPTGRIRKISSGGYVTAALTEDNDLYVWGGRPRDTKFLEELTGTPLPVDLDGEDVLDVAIGMNHMIALSSKHKLFVVGNGGNGQLGLDIEELKEWKEISLPLIEGQQVVSVHAGYKNSFVLIESLT